MDFLLYVCVFCAVWCGALSQYAKEESFKQASASLDYFGLRLLAEVSAASGDSLNIAVAPYIIWSMLGVINEGARNRTERQITATLGIPQQSFKETYRSFHNNITSPADGITLAITNVIFLPEHERSRLNSDFKSVVSNYYGVNVLTEDFSVPDVALNRMNRYMAQATSNRINNFFLPDDLKDVVILLCSAFYFKGAWNLPFNVSRTTRETFYNENNQPIGKVDMMYQTGAFPYSTIAELGALALELPYGRGDKMSMIVLLPKKGTSLMKVLRSLSETKFSDILNILEKAQNDYLDEDVQVYLPKFKIHSDLILNQVLDTLGIKDLFNSQDADLTGMVNNYLYVSKLIQQSVIEVDEEGTVAAAVAGASFTNKSPPPKFRADRPFAFLIVDKPTRSILFTGKVSNPNTVQ